ncbi:PKD domain-containing protein [Dinghuibacter silviterrae]|uniref:Gliding motility-associated-like protein n=1 Tax=Dinghuibacter silviterrae TaxID=1539049 RepID=A0A4R8DUP3_9BACT|nr:PKD domain-containing protein [Dinghuibacter silviterrae]TDX02094.1 gliding motility-associated-like protein [Dinghuibacter silviterrae]
MKHFAYIFLALSGYALPHTAVGGAPPTLSSTLTPGPVCSGSAFLYVPSSSSAQVGYTWSRAAVPGIANPAATGEGAIDETLVNTTSLPITVSYQYTLYSQGVTNTQTVQVVVNPSPTVGFTVSDPIPCTGSQYIFTNTSSIGSGTLTYQWAFGDGNTSTLTNPSDFYTTGAGVYTATLVATSSAGCQASASRNVTVNALPFADFTLAVTGSPAFTEWTIDYTNTSQGGTAYQWDFNGVTQNQAPPTNQTQYTFMLPYFQLGSQLTVTNAAGCSQAASQSFFAPGDNYGPNSEFFIGTAPGANNTDRGCQGVTLYFTNTSTVPPNQVYTWNYSDGGADQGLNMTTAQHTFTTPGTWLVTETEASPGGGLTASWTYRTVNIYPAATPPTFSPGIAGGTLLLCPGQSTEPYSFGNAKEGMSFAWTTTGGATGAPASGNGAFLPAFTAAANVSNAPVSSTVKVTETSPYGCGTASSNIVVTVNPTPVFTGAYAAQNVCSGATVNGYTLSATPAGATYSWTNSDPVTGLAATGSGNVPAFTGTTYAPAPETSTVTLKATNNGCSATTAYTFTVRPSPDLSTTLAPAAVCSGTPFVYTPQSTTTGVTYNWSRAAVPGISNPGNLGAGNVNETLVNTTANPVTAVYAYTLQAGGCPNTQDVDLVVNPLPDVLLPAGAAQTVCSGAMTNAVPLTGDVTGTVFNWTNSNPAIGLAASGTGTIPGFTAGNAGTGNIQITAQRPAGCVMAAPAGFTFTVNPLQAPTVTAPSGTLLCPGDSVALVASGAPSYQWYDNGQPVNGAVTDTYDAYQTGSFTVTAITAQGCRDSSAPAEVVTLIPQPIMGFLDVSPVCTGQAVSFTNATTEPGGTIPLTWWWHDDAGNTSTFSSPSFTYPNAGSYTVTLVATPGGCATREDSIAKVVVVTPPANGVTLPVVTTETGVATQLDARNFGNVIYLWTPPTGLSNPQIEDPVATLASSQQYLITMTLPSGCSTTDTLEVEVFPKGVVYIPKAFTPNGDGVNDLFVIAGINNYPGSSLTVYNRWGKQVYFASSYANDWNGAGLEQGAYIYVLRLNTGNGIRIFKGTVVLIR